MDRQRELEDLGYTVTVMWECDLRCELQHDPEMKAYFANCGIHEPLNVREGFFGGSCPYFRSLFLSNYCLF